MEHFGNMDIYDYEIDNSGSLTDVDETTNNPADERGGKAANRLKLDIQWQRAVRSYWISCVRRTN